MKKLCLISIILFFGIINIYSQKLVDISSGTSCENAIEISTTEVFGPTTPPVSITSETDGMFANTQNIVWYEFEAEDDGYLLFEIIPVDTLDNYDFALYKGKGEGFCNDIITKSKKPIRTNFYRNDMTKAGMTGLSIFGDEKSYSEGVEVKKGDNFYLLLNNIYQGGSGHSLSFKYLKNYTVKGSVIDKSTGEPISNAMITWENIRDEEEIFTATSDKKGDFELQIIINVENHSFPRYYFYAYSDAYFISDTVVLSKQIPDIDQNKFEFELAPIKIGYNYTELPNLYFEPNESDLVAGSEKILEKIALLMKINSNMEIRIEGHTNGFYPSTSLDEMLSENRAKEIRTYFTEKGISEDRISVSGLGSTKMIYPIPEDEIQEGFNRRVEFYIVKY